MEPPSAPPEWDSQAREMQQNFYNNLGDRHWDQYKRSEQVYLLKNIGFALFGPPQEEAFSTEKDTGYSTVQLKEIELICKKIKENDCHTSMKKQLQENIRELFQEYSLNEPTIKESRERELHISEILSVIDTYDDSNDEMLRKLHFNIAGALCYAAVSENTLFDKKTSKILKVVNEHILSAINGFQGTLVSVVFVVTQVEIEKAVYPYPEPVFRVPNDDDGVDEVRFIDRNQRVYRGWDQYLKNNKLPKGCYCYPESGIYNGDENYNVQVEFGVTPASKLINKVLNAGDVAGTVIGFGAGVIGIAALIPAITIAAPVAVGAMVGCAATGLYGAGRGIENIVDRSKHDEDISLGNAEARNTYISIAGCSLGIFAMGATSATAMLAREGQVIGSVGRFVVNALQISSLGVNGIGIATAAFNLQQKYKDGNLTTLDVFQFSSSVLFFSMSAVNFRTAKTIIQETQQSTLNDFRSNLRSNRHRKGFDKLSRNTRQGLNTMDGNAKVIRSINKIYSKDDFFSGVSRINKHHSHGSTKMRFGDDPNSVQLNDAVKVDPTSFANLNKVDRLNVIEATRNLGSGSINRAGFDKVLFDIASKNGIKFNNSLVIAESNVCNAFGASSLQEIEAKGKGMFFSKLSESGLRIIAKVLSNPNVTREIVKATVEVFDKLWEGALPEDFQIRLEFTLNFIVEQVRLMEVAYQSALLAFSNEPNFDREEFDRDYGIIGDRLKHFTECFVALYSITKNIAEFRQAYEIYRASRES